jgi:hypothetical protein
VAGGTGGQASGHRGIVVELEDGAATPDEELRRSAMRSSSTVAAPDGAQGFTWDYCNLRKETSERQARAL